MHKKLINDLHNIAFGIVSSVGNYYSNVEKIHQGNPYLLPKHKKSQKGEEKGRKNCTKRRFTEQTLAVKPVLHLCYKKRGENLNSRLQERVGLASRASVRWSFLSPLCLHKEQFQDEMRAGTHSWPACCTYGGEASWGTESSGQNPVQALVLRGVLYRGEHQRLSNTLSV